MNRPMTGALPFLYAGDQAAHLLFPLTIQISLLPVEPLIHVSSGIVPSYAGNARPAASDSFSLPAGNGAALEPASEAGQFPRQEWAGQANSPAGMSAPSGPAITLPEDNTAGLKIISSAIPAALVGTPKGLYWPMVSGASPFQVEYIQGTAAVSVQTFSNGLEHFGLPGGDWQWRVRAADSAEWTQGNDIRIDAPPTAPQHWQGQTNGLDELFFSRKYDTWSANYQAQHVGILGSWEGTGETVALEGKNKIADVFSGTENDVSILLLTDDENGDALFVDDIYTEMPDTLQEQQARVARINEIRAGAGDDIVDLTSRRFAYIGSGVTVRGGLGDDVIWANEGDNRLFGDAGNDRLVGASGNDILAGGSGNDSLHGGGGDDTFCFGTDWGQDTVQQLSGGKVTLWFTEGDLTHWNADTLTYTDGDNSVTVIGISDVTLKFGSGISGIDAARYSELQSCGAFASATSEKIFGVVSNPPGSDSGMEFPTGESGENPNPLT